MTKVLIIEDEDSIRENIAELLEIEDFEVETAANGIQGLETAKKTIPDLILCDVMMPKMDGYQVLTELRKHSETANTPFIFLTAKAERMDLRQGMNLGADDYLTKPCSSQELLEAIVARLQRNAQQQEQLKQLERYDQLTGLPNLQALSETNGYLQQAIAKRDKQKNLVPFLLLGLDRFQRVNEAIGYPNGDLILKQLAQRFNQFIQPIEGTIIARLNGDEFGIILPPVAQTSEVEDLTQSLLNLVSEPFNINGQRIPVTTTIGVAFYPYASTLEELRRQAGIAMGEAKKLGGNRSQIYIRPLFGSDQSQQFQLIADFREAWEHQQLKVYYQPRIDLRRRKIVGVGTAIYWHHPQLGVISQAQISDLMTESGLTLTLSEWMLKTAVKQAQVWQNSRLSLQVAVPFSELLFTDKNIIQKLINLCQEFGDNPSSLELEIDADLIAQAKNLNALAAQLLNIKQLNIKIIISQFNLEHTTISYLGELPIDSIKLDSRLLQTLSPKSTIIDMITSITKRLKLKFIADGVETDEQLILLKKQKCDQAQQVLLVSASEIKQLVKKTQSYNLF
ncbi:GGDEF domain-containing response regulator [Lyngbya sp. PCC 8106]|uniref:EAL domain-containing response regulator n=1 Tax=Lyngbya sp. (strain PCC 8106) TaxID=313612 RepID=UPI0000EA89EE|nr:GGDEF domain-containing response regulator [Lyngbya sp. PCC 8106]EAW37291.1 Hybrid signal transduction histidine kinase and diguanylatecyclase/phosphodiesterase [Lyngbya sp. PCC 8106]